MYINLHLLLIKAKVARLVSDRRNLQPKPHATLLLGLKEDTACIWLPFHAHVGFCLDIDMLFLDTFVNSGFMMRMKDFMQAPGPLICEMMNQTVMI